jgi:hypothetical protein
MRAILRMGTTDRVDEDGGAGKSWKSGARLEAGYLNVGFDADWEVGRWEGAPLQVRQRVPSD